MIDEASHGLDAEVVSFMGRVAIYSATPTTADQWLLRNLAEKPYASVGDFLGDKCNGLNFYRAILPDDIVLHELVEELERRNVHVRWRKESSEQDHIALISEWDTFYGQGLPLTFAADVSQKPVWTADEARRQAPWVRTFSYLRGLDGKLPGEATGGEGAKSGTGGDDSADSKKLSQVNSSEDAPEGLNQADYLRRLAHDLDEHDRVLTRLTGRGVQAIGVLGSDVYDKLMILRALRERFPGAVFFSTNLDARLAHAAEWRASHNLVIASSFGLSLHPYYQKQIPPFRDSYQTAFFVAALRTLQVMPENVEYGRPRVYEIGRDGAHDLSVVGPKINPSHLYEYDLASENMFEKAPATLQPPRQDLAGWWTARRWGPVVIAIVAISTMLLWLMLRGVRPAEILWPKLAVLTAPWQILVSALIVLVLYLVVRAQIVGGTPFSLTAGISLWPTESLRLLAGSLCVHFIVKAYYQVHESDKKLHDAFGLSMDAMWPAATSPSLKLAAVDLSSASKPDYVDPRRVWTRYRSLGQRRGRLRRALWFTFLYLAVGFCLMRILGFPTPPARGGLARIFAPVFRVAVWRDGPAPCRVGTYHSSNTCKEAGPCRQTVTLRRSLLHH